MARPRFKGKIYRYRLTLCLREGEDDDLINWFDSLPRRGKAAAVIARLRTGEGNIVETAVAKQDAVSMLFSLIK